MEQGSEVQGDGSEQRVKLDGNIYGRTLST